MARMVIEIDFPTLTVQDLRDLVVANDASADDVPIAPEHVTPRHVMDLIESGNFPTVPANMRSDFFEV